jgi:hypothetical protein
MLRAGFAFQYLARAVADLRLIIKVEGTTARETN